MLAVRAPILHRADITDLRPTQISVGMREVEDKRHRWREKGAGNEKEFLQSHVVPVVTGPKGRHYIIDHHHLVRALHDEGVKTVYVTPVVDLSRVEKDAFWVVLDTRSLMQMSITRCSSLSKAHLLKASRFALMIVLPAHRQRAGARMVEITVPRIVPDGPP